MTDNLDVIAAFADGEHVEADALKAALANEAGRDYLVDVLALRGLVSEAPAARAVAAEPSARSRLCWSRASPAASRLDARRQAGSLRSQSRGRQW
jgi:hypothetical protein